jgi:hypothetical protein
MMPAWTAGFFFAACSPVTAASAVIALACFLAAGASVGVSTAGRFTAPPPEPAGGPPEATDESAGDPAGAAGEPTASSVVSPSFTTSSVAVSAAGAVVATVSPLSIRSIVFADAAASPTAADVEGESEGPSEDDGLAALLARSSAAVEEEAAAADDDDDDDAPKNRERFAAIDGPALP